MNPARAFMPTAAFLGGRIVVLAWHCGVLLIRRQRSGLLNLPLLEALSLSGSSSHESREAYGKPRSDARRS